MAEMGIPEKCSRYMIVMYQNPALVDSTFFTFHLLFLQPSSSLLFPRYLSLFSLLYFIFSTFIHSYHHIHTFIHHSYHHRQYTYTFSNMNTPHQDVSDSLLFPPQLHTIQRTLQSPISHFLSPLLNQSPQIDGADKPQSGHHTQPRYSANVSHHNLIQPTLTSQNPYAYAEQYFGDSPIGHGKFDKGLFIPAQDYHPQSHDYLVNRSYPSIWYNR